MATRRKRSTKMAPSSSLIDEHTPGTIAQLVERIAAKMKALEEKVAASEIPKPPQLQQPWLASAMNPDYFALATPDAAATRAKATVAERLSNLSEASMCHSQTIDTIISRLNKIEADLGAL